MIGIYKFTNKYNRKCYIGKSVDIEGRYKAHLRAAKHGDKTLFYNALRKYGIEGFDFNVLIECSKENLNYWEKFYIRYYCSNNRDWGYNLTYGGDGISVWDDEMRKKHSEIHLGQISSRKGKHLTEETKEKLRQANLGKKQSQETILKRVEKLKGHGISEEGRKKLRQANLGRVVTEETRQKISNTLLGNIPWNKGMKGKYTAKKRGPMSEETKRKISETKKLRNQNK